MAATSNHYNVQPSTFNNSSSSRINSSHTSTHGYSTPTVRVLARRYQLTSSCNKYLDIGINACLPTPTVEIAVGDHRGNEIILDYTNWQLFLQQRHIFTDEANEYGDLAPLTSPIERKKISLHITRFINRRVLCMQSPDVRITMIYPTVRYMLALAPCVDRTVEALNSAMHMVNYSVMKMRQIAATASNTASIAVQIRDSQAFDHTSIIDCELVAIIYERNVPSNV